MIYITVSFFSFHNKHLVANSRSTDPCALELCIPLHSITTADTLGNVIHSNESSTPKDAVTLELVLATPKFLEPLVELESLTETPNCYDYKALFTPMFSKDFFLDVLC